MPHTIDRGCALQLFGDIVGPRNRLELGKKAFTVAGPTAWNNLPLSVTLAHCKTTFKTALKTHLFSAAYGASKYQWLACASMISICFCKATLRRLPLRRFINCEYYITLHYMTVLLHLERCSKRVKIDDSSNDQFAYSKNTFQKFLPQRQKHWWSGWNFAAKDSLSKWIHTPKFMV